MDSRLRGNDGERARLADMAEQAARLAKADLVTGMVGEFPELQGVMGGYYARAEGLPAEVADRSEEHTSELQSLMRISYAVFCLKKKKNNKPNNVDKDSRKIHMTNHKIE